jgi:alkylation response protein AidB-like acyl-CoA dehydrogenase
MAAPSTIVSPDDPTLEQLCQALAERADALDGAGAWPSDQLAICRRAGVFGWFVPSEWGGTGWSDVDLLRAYLKLSSACLSTTFVLTQPHGACRRIVASENDELKARILPGLARGERLATVGISHLTTSRRHLARPVLAARADCDGFILEGTIPWVTGAVEADFIVTGATCDDGRQILALLPTEAPGVTPLAPARLVGLTATCTGEVRCEGVRLGGQWLLDGPVEGVLTRGRGAGTGGLQTSALAIGLSSAAIAYLQSQATDRPDLVPAAAALRGEYRGLEAEVLALAAGAPAAGYDDLRSRANSLVLRAAQGALAAAKGSGYVAGHPVGRWCREALFFLVWSCPQPVMAAALCELAGLDG